MTTTAPRVGPLIVDAFLVSRVMHSATDKQWTTASMRAGGKLPHSLISYSVKCVGELDILCRALEDEMTQFPPDDEQMDFRCHYLRLLSDLWIGSAYAVSYAFSDRGLYGDDPEFSALAEDLRLVRVQVEKHQIPSDKKLNSPIELRTAPGQSGSVRIFEYDKKDPLRSHIGRTGLSERCSTMWQVIDLKNGSAMRWIERRSLADRALQSLSK